MQLKNKKTIIIVTGGPGTGKSYAAREIAAGIDHLTVISYDSIKEKNFDLYGYDNREQKDALNWFGLEEFYLTVRKNMWLEKTIMIEYPFYQRHRERLEKLIEEYDYQAVTIHLHGDLKIIYERGVKRDSGAGRHPGHLTNSYHVETFQKNQPVVHDAGLTFEEFQAEMARKNYDIRLGVTISVDITDFSKVDYKEVVRRIGEISGRA